jgi:hypothetical protein
MAIVVFRTVLRESIASTVLACGRHIMSTRGRTGYATSSRCFHRGSFSQVRPFSAVVSSQNTLRLPLGRRHIGGRKFLSHAHELQSQRTSVELTFGVQRVGSERHSTAAASIATASLASPTDDAHGLNPKKAHSGRLPERVLVIGKVWPERSSSAAGVRTGDLVRRLSHQNKND